MPFLIRIILQRSIAVGLGFLSFLGVQPTIPTAEQVITIDKQQQEIITTILQDYNQKPVDLDTNLIEQLINPEETNKSTSSNDVDSKNKSQPTDIKIALPQNQTLPEKDLPSEQNLDNPINIIIETINKEITPKTTEELTIENVLVNIICTENENNYISVNTGSGVIISADGVVITNAHVGQYFLLDKELDNYNCALYQENIPTYGYVADLLYISPDWIEENKEVITSANPRGTGENDYALLYITKNTNPSLSKPNSFNYAQLNTTYQAEIGDDITVAGFPGAPASIVDLNRSVQLKKDSTYIEDIFTFKDNQIDVISTDPTHVAARGASGGGVFRNNNLIALIVTTGGSKENAYINAITANYINRDLQKDFGLSLSTLISGNLKTKVIDFWNNYGHTLAEVILEQVQ